LSLHTDKDGYKRPGVKHVSSRVRRSASVIELMRKGKVLMASEADLIKAELPEAIQLTMGKAVIRHEY